jgi:hypothetical protein
MRLDERRGQGPATIGNQAATLPAAIRFFSVSQTVRTSDVIREQSSICKK